MKGLFVILGFYGLGAALHRYGHVPLPGNVIGMLLLAFALVKGWVNVGTVEKAAAFLLNHILLFFIPVIILSVAVYGGVFAEKTAVVLAALVAGPPLVMLVTGKVAERLLPAVCRESADTASEERRTSHA